MRVFFQTFRPEVKAVKRLAVLILIPILALLPCCALAAEPASALADYQAQKGFSAYNAGTNQLGILVHDLESWRAGATDRPTEFYLNIMPQRQLCGDRHCDIIEAVKRYNILSIGLTLHAQGDSRQLVVSDRGVKGVRSYDLLRSAGSDYDALLNLASGVLGYPPGNMNFLGKRSVHAVLEWRDDSIIVTDGATLAQLDALLNGAVPAGGRIDGAFNAFLTLQYADGDSASIALSTEGAGACFYRGMFFRYGEENRLLGLFGLTGEAFSILTGGEAAEA